MEQIEQQLINVDACRIAVKLSLCTREELKRSPLTFVLMRNSRPHATWIQTELHRLGYRSVKITDDNDLVVAG